MPAQKVWAGQAWGVVARRQSGRPQRRLTRSAQSAEAGRGRQKCNSSAHSALENNQHRSKVLWCHMCGARTPLGSGRGRRKPALLSMLLQGGCGYENLRNAPVLALERRLRSPVRPRQRHGESGGTIIRRTTSRVPVRTSTRSRWRWRASARRRSPSPLSNRRLRLRGASPAKVIKTTCTRESPCSRSAAFSTWRTMSRSRMRRSKTAC